MNKTTTLVTRNALSDSRIIFCFVIYLCLSEQPLLVNGSNTGQIALVMTIIANIYMQIVISNNRSDNTHYQQVLLRQFGSHE